MEAALAYALLAKAIEYGPEVVMALIVALNKETITLEDIKGLKITKEPEEY